MGLIMNAVFSFLRCTHYIACFFVVFLVLSVVGNFQLFLSQQALHQWDPESSVLLRFLYDGGLLLMFMAQHTLMATDWFKTKLSSWLGVTVSQRIVYTVTSSLTLFVLILKWQSIPEAYLWMVETYSRTLLWLFFLLLHILAWLLLGLECVLMDTADMLGISWVHNYYTSKSPPQFTKVRKLREIYSRMRHPGAVLLTFILWVHPLMTLDRLLMASVLTSYMIGRHSFEESHYQFAEKYFSSEYTVRKTKTTVEYEYVEEDD